MTVQGHTLYSVSQHTNCTCVFTPSKEWCSHNRAQATTKCTQSLSIAIDCPSGLSQRGVTDEDHHTGERHHSEEDTRSISSTTTVYQLPDISVILLYSHTYPETTVDAVIFNFYVTKLLRIGSKTVYKNVPVM